MYLHLGKGTVVNTDEIIGIFDLDITSQSHLTRKYCADDLDVWYDSSLEQFKDMKNQTTAEEFYKDHNSARGENGFGSTSLDH